MELTGKRNRLYFNGKKSGGINKVPLFRMGRDWSSRKSVGMGKIGSAFGANEQQENRKMFYQRTCKNDGGGDGFHGGRRYGEERKQRNLGPC